MSIELSNNFFLACNLKRMNPKYPAQTPHQGSLANTFQSNQHQRCLSVSIWMLDCPSDPANHVISEFLIASSNHFIDMFPDQTPISSYRFNTPALPQIETFIHHPRCTGLKQNSSILLPISMAQPPLAQPHPHSTAFSIKQFNPHKTI